MFQVKSCHSSVIRTWSFPKCISVSEWESKRDIGKFFMYYYDSIMYVNILFMINYSYIIHGEKRFSKLLV